MTEWYKKNRKRILAKCAIYRDKVNFGGNRKIALKRDGYKCVKCGGKDINVDHIDRNGTGKPIHRKNNLLNNLQTLCSRCHSIKDRTENGFCKRGHAYIVKNLYVRKGGKSTCKLCRRIVLNRWRLTTTCKKR